MRISDPSILNALPQLGVERIAEASLAERTSLGIGGTTDLLLLRRHGALPGLIALLRGAGVAYKFLGGGTNLLVRDGELPWVFLQWAHQEPELRLEGNSAHVDTSADLGPMATFSAPPAPTGIADLPCVPRTLRASFLLTACAYFP